MAEVNAKPQYRGKEEYVIRVYYSKTGAAKSIISGWYCGLSDASRPPRRVVFDTDPQHPRIRRYLTPSICKTKIVRDIFSDPHIHSANIVALDPDNRTQQTVFNLNFIGKRRYR